MTNTSHDSETAAHGQQVFSACAFIHKKVDDADYVFLAKRASSKKFLPGVFELPGGHIDYGEEMVDGLRREVMEELRVHITVGDPFYVYTYLNRIKGSHTIEVVYFASFDILEENIKINPDDHSEYGWFNFEEVNSIVAANRARVLDSKSIQTDVDDELLAMVKGFALLDRSRIDFG
jgi:8-oxo-dGTP diphosphatase